MSEGTTPPADQPPAPAQTPPPATTPPPAEPASPTIRTQVADALHDLLGSGKAKVADKPAEPERDVAAQVRREVDKIHTQKERDSLVDGLRQKVEQLTAAVEKAPKQIRRVERWMGWRTGDDDE